MKIEKTVNGFNEEAWKLTAENEVDLFYLGEYYGKCKANKSCYVPDITDKKITDVTKCYIIVDEETKNKYVSDLELHIKINNKLKRG